MKINEGPRIAQEKISPAKQRTGQEKAVFQDLLHKHETRMTSEQLTRLMSEIERQGHRLAQLQTSRELGLYKKLIKQLMEEAVRHGIGLENRTSFGARGRERRLKLLRQLDKKLLELTETVLSEQKKSIDLLDQIGEIRGILLNLYF